MEDYLEIIYLLCREDGLARVKDIAERLEVSNPSVVGAVKNLKRRLLVCQERYGYIKLTEQGRRLALEVHRKHEILKNFLENTLGVSADTASRDACRIEHAVSPETIRRIRAMAEFLEKKGNEDTDWRTEFDRFLTEVKRSV
jgi:DtxR family Mn-dependent transcriptional regulator